MCFISNIYTSNNANPIREVGITSLFYTLLAIPALLPLLWLAISSFFASAISSAPLLLVSSLVDDVVDVIVSVILHPFGGDSEEKIIALEEDSTYSDIW